MHADLVEAGVDEKGTGAGSSSLGLDGPKEIMDIVEMSDRILDKLMEHSGARKKATQGIKDAANREFKKREPYLCNACPRVDPLLEFATYVLQSLLLSMSLDSNPPFQAQRVM